MSHTHQSPHSHRREARIAEEHYIAYLHGADFVDAIDHRGRRRYYLGPQPCRRTDAGRSASAWWMALAVLIAIVPIAFPLPWWWW
jgi:hypothetical protein